MALLSFQLRDVRTRTELAARLGVNVRALDLVSLTSNRCTTPDCNLPAVENNRKRCVLHQQVWYPREVNEKGERLKNCRGHGLHGPQFMRGYRGASGHPNACCCDSSKCEEIGYSHEGMMRVPQDETKCEATIRLLGIQCPILRKKIKDNPKAHRVAPWHYHKEHRMRGENRNWAIRPLPHYKDKENVVYAFAPPNASVEAFINEEIPSYGFCRGGYDDSLPAWVREALQFQGEQATPASAPARIDPAIARSPKSMSNKSRKVVTPAPASAPRAPRKRASPETTENVDLRDELRTLKAQLASAMDRIDGLEATVRLKDDKLIEITFERDNLLKENAKLRALIEQLESKKMVLSYDELRPGGVLADHVKEFTFFPNFKCNDAFLHLFNFTEESEPGDGLCEGLVRYSTVSVAERKKYNDALRAQRAETAQQRNESSEGAESGGDPMDTDDAGTDLAEIAEEAMEEAASADATQRRSGRRRRKLDWQTEYLVYCFYAKCNISMKRTGALFGIGRTLVHDIVYAWANVLCITLAKFFPTPTRSQMLRAYPVSVLKKFGHANIFMLLDATEGFADVASMKTVNAILYSAYKHHSTVKWLVGCDPIGTTWDESISEGFPGAISDVVATDITNILEQVPFGSSVEVDKGFLIENSCALLGIASIRPMKMLEKQTQQSKEDAALTQKVGKTRIPIEQANGQMKRATGFFDKNIRLDQLGLADLIFRASYLLQNFKLPFIQGRDEDAPKTGRPCKAAIRWYGETDDGLVDIRPEVEMWGTATEIALWRVLRNAEANNNLSDTEISELVLAKNLPSKLRAEHIAKLEALANGPQ